MRRPEPLPAAIANAPFRVADALEAGVTRDRLRSSDLVMPFHGVRATSADSVLELASAYAPLLPPHHCFGGVTAARLWGLPIATAWSEDEALVIARVHGANRGFVTGTRQIAVRSDTLQMRHLGLRMLTPLATALTLARELEHEHLVQVLDALLTDSRNYPGLLVPRESEAAHVTPTQLATFIEAHAGLNGIVALRAAAEDARAGVDSRFETITRVLIVEAGLPEPVVHPEVVIDGITYRPDLGYVDQKVAIEYEGEQHREDRRWQQDIDRYAHFEAAGWSRVRVTNRDLGQRGARLIARLQRVLDQRS